MDNTIEIELSQTSRVPLYQQIIDGIKQLIATNRLQPGERLPTVRKLAQCLHINPGTVVRAYLQLEQQGIITSRRGAGTSVSSRINNPQILTLRHNRLAQIVVNSIVDILSQGYSPEELEAAFSMSLSRMREERRNEQKYVNTGTDSTNTLRIAGSHDLALNLLIGKFKHRNPDINVNIKNTGSLGGLIALQEGTADIAGTHLLDKETGEYNSPYVKRILPGREIVIVNLAYRIQGLMFASGNPKNIQGVADLKRPDITLVNRQQSSGTRILLDLTLRKISLSADEIKGYDQEMDTHLAVARHIARGKADTGLGIEAAAHTCGLDFLPLSKERYDLIIPLAKYQAELMAPLLEIINSDEFKNVVNEMGGYDTAETGSVTFIN